MDSRSEEALRASVELRLRRFRTQALTWNCLDDGLRLAALVMTAGAVGMLSLGHHGLAQSLAGVSGMLYSSCRLIQPGERARAAIQRAHDLEDALTTALEHNDVNALRQLEIGSC